MPDLGGLPALDTAIGMLFVFFLLSTLCSMLNESVANVLGWRAKTLEDAIRNLVGDPKVKRGWKEWFGAIDKTPSEESPPPEDRGSAATSADRGPATVKPVAPVADVPPDLTSALFEQWRIRGLVRDPKSRLRRRRRPSYLSPAAFSLAVAEKLAEGAPEVNAASEPGPRTTAWQQADEDILRRLEAALENLPDGQLRELLQKAGANAHGTLDGFRLQVERGFDDAMERASGWYKRKVQLVLLVLAAAIAIGLNVDSVRVATSLWHEAPVRAAVAAQAATQAGGPQSAADAAAEVTQLQLPVGWGENTPDNVAAAIPGWLITIAALGLGAPFWFDLLSRLARLRGSGVPERPRSLNDTAGTGSPERGSTAARVAAAASAAATRRG